MLVLLAKAERARMVVSGLDLVERAVLTAQEAGLRVVILVGHQERHLVTRRLSLNPRVRQRPEVRDLGDWGWCGHLEADGVERVLVGTADRVWTRALLPAVLSADLPEGGLALVGLGPGLPEREEDFAGLVVASPGLAREVAGAMARGFPALREFAADRGASVVSHRGFALVMGPRDLWAAETVLLQSLVKPADGIVSRSINRKISLSLSRYLARSRVHPNMVTAVVLLIGLASGPFAALGTGTGFLVGGLLYYLAAILDGCDGELSRLQFLGSDLGAWFDTVTDDLTALSFLAGLYVGLYRAHQSWWWLLLGGVAVAGNLVAVLLRYRVMVAIGKGDHQKLPQPAPPDTTTWQGRVEAFLRGTVFRTDFLPFAAFVVCLVGLPEVFAAPYPFGALAAAWDSLKLTLSRQGP